TSGNATKAPIGPFSQERVRASHHARGVPINSRISVVSAASSRVRTMALMFGSLKRVTSCQGLQIVAEGADDGLDRFGLQVVGPFGGGLVVLAVRQDNGILADRLMQVGRHDPAGAALQLAVFEHL